jgi:amino acid transporter
MERRIGVRGGLALAVGNVIGTGLFGLSGAVISSVGAANAIVAWPITIVMMAPMIYIFQRLAVAYGESGGLSAYAEAAVGPIGRTITVFVLLGTFPIGMMVASWIGGEYLATLFWSHPSTQQAILIGGVMLIVAGLLNRLGTKWSTGFNIISMWLIIGFILSVIVLNTSLLRDGLAAIPNQINDVSFPGVVAGIVLMIWAFLGWENMSFAVAEFKDPRRTVPIVFWVSFIVISLGYLLLAATVNGASIAGEAMARTDGLMLLLPVEARPFVIVVVAFLIIANLNAWLMGFGRLLYSAGKTGIAPSVVGRLNRHGAPENALWVAFGLFGIAFAVAAFTGLPISLFITLVSQNFIVLYAISILAYLKLHSHIQ